MPGRRPTFNKPIARSDPSRRTFQDVVFDSIVEMNRATELERLKRSDDVFQWFRQVPFQLGPDHRVRIDFVVVKIIDSDVPVMVWAEDVKGFDNPGWRKTARLWWKYGPVDLAVMWPKRGGGWTVERILGGKAGHDPEHLRQAKAEHYGRAKSKAAAPTLF